MKIYSAQPNQITLRPHIFLSNGDFDNNTVLTPTSCDDRGIERSIW